MDGGPNQKFPVDRTIESLAAVTGLKSEFLKQQIADMHFHNWSKDPFSRGAYSYIVTGGVNKWKRLTQPFAEKIYFAGEATAEGPTRGTVHGAILSGIRSANQILKRG